MIKAVQSTTSPTLSSGAFNETFDGMEQVLAVAVAFTDPLTNDYVFEATNSVSGNVVAITLRKQQISAGNTWANAVTSDFSGKIVTTVAYGH